MRCTTDLVSVIIPVKDCSLYIVDCVNSILNQTHQNFEILICDDHSCDNSLELIGALNDDRIIVFKNEGRRSFGRSRFNSLIMNFQDEGRRFLSRSQKKPMARGRNIYIILGGVSIGRKACVL